MKTYLKYIFFKYSLDMTTVGNVSALLAHIPDNEDEPMKLDNNAETDNNPETSLVGHLF